MLISSWLLFGSLWWGSHNLTHTMEEGKETMISNELETAQTLLNIMSSSNGVAASRTEAYRHSHKKSNKKDSAEATLLKSEEKCSRKASGASTMDGAVPNPLHSVTADKGTTSSRMSSNDSASGSPRRQQKLTFAAPPYLAPQNANFLIRSPSTYSFLQTMLAQQHASLATSPSIPTSVVNPILLPNPVIATVTSSSKEQQADIRQEEVEKALHSKPQRGRKRRNLNDEERQELTRTRNREHAKSTRERKKQRHTELLDMERSYLTMRSHQALQEERRHTVCRFLDARGAMLQQAFTNDTSAAANVDALILSRSDFRYHIRGQRGGTEIDGVTLMGLFDKSFATLVAIPDMQGVSYRYEASAIGITERGDAVLECGISFGSRCFKTLHMTISFAEGTSKILAVNVAFLQEESDRPPSLGNQISHPSVVSLDDRLYIARSKTEDEDQ